MYTYYETIATLNNLNILGEILYSRFPKSCVDNHNLIKYTNKNVDECKELCSQNNKCVAFEYGVAYREGGTYKSRDCTLSDSVEKDGCPGFYHNLDLYVKGNDYKCYRHLSGHWLSYLCLTLLEISHVLFIDINISY